MVPVFQWRSRKGCASSVRTIKGRREAADGSENSCSCNCEVTAFYESMNKKCTVNYTLQSLERNWRDVEEASFKYSRTVQSSGSEARRRAHHPCEPEALIASMTRILSTFTGVADGPREYIMRRKPGQLLNSSLLEYTNLSSIERQGFGSVLHFGESR